MKVYKSSEIKNIAILGNAGSGKTTLTESILFESGQIQRRGRVSQKNTVSDYFPVPPFSTLRTMVRNSTSSTARVPTTSPALP